jgi:hypothetical protein
LIFYFRSVDKIPQCAARNLPPVWFTGVLLAGMVLITPREERLSAEKNSKIIKTCTGSHRDSALLAFYMRHCRRELFNIFEDKNIFHLKLLILTLPKNAVSATSWTA